jgi:hypothetical protein
MSSGGRRAGSGELSPRVAGMVKRKEVSGNFKLKRLIRILEAIGDYDEIRDRRRRSISRWRWILLPVAIVSTFLLFFSLAALPDSMLFLIPLTTLPLAVIILVVLSIKNRALATSDLPNDFRLCLIPFLKAMREDIDLAGKVKLKLDLAGASREKVTGEIEVPSPPQSRCTKTTYTDRWCFLDAPLAGDGRLLLTILNHYTHTVRTRRNPRGKIKTKSKWKKRVVVKAGLAPQEGNLSFSRQAFLDLAGREDFTLTEKEGGSVATLKRKYSFASVNDAPRETVSPGDLLAMFFLLGSTLQPAQTGR